MKPKKDYSIKGIPAVLLFLIPALVGYIVIGKVLVEAAIEALS